MNNKGKEIKEKIELKMAKMINDSFEPLSSFFEIHYLNNSNLNTMEEKLNSFPSPPIPKLSNILKNQSNYILDTFFKKRYMKDYYLTLGSFYKEGSYSSFSYFYFMLQASYFFSLSIFFYIRGYDLRDEDRNTSNFTQIINLAKSSFHSSICKKILFSPSGRLALQNPLLTFISYEDSIVNGFDHLNKSYLSVFNSRETENNHLLENDFTVNSLDSLFFQIFQRNQQLNYNGVDSETNQDLEKLLGFFELESNKISKKVVGFDNYQALYDAYRLFLKEVSSVYLFIFNNPIEQQHLSL